MRTKKCVCGVILFLQKWINMFVFLWRLCKYINVFVFHLLSDVSCLMCSFNYCVNRENAMRFNSFFKSTAEFIFLLISEWSFCLKECWCISCKKTAKQEFVGLRSSQEMVSLYLYYSRADTSYRSNPTIV